MGQYDNFHNVAAIEAASRKLNKLLKKPEGKQFEIEQAEKELAAQKLFENSQSFGSDIPVLFSDDNEVLRFGEILIPYDELKSYEFRAVRERKTHTTTKPKGAFTRAVVGDILAGSAGAVIGAVTAKQESTTTHIEIENGFVLELHTVNEKGYYIGFGSAGIISNKIPRPWALVGAKLQEIVESRTPEGEKSQVAGLVSPTGQYAVEKQGDTLKLIIGLIVGTLIGCFMIWVLVGGGSESVRNYWFFVALFGILTLVGVWATATAIKQLRCREKSESLFGKIAILLLALAVTGLGAFILLFAATHPPIN